MSEIEVLSRRTLLSYLTQCALGSALVTAFGRPRPDLAQELAGAFGDPAGRRAVGRAYLRAFPEEGRPGLLLRGIYGERVIPKVAEVRPMLRRQVRDDFRRGRVVELEGWVLSVTEARLCAFSHLMEESRRTWRGRV